MNDFTAFDIQCMQRALDLAHLAISNNEVPVGAVIALDVEQRIIGEGHNQPIKSNDPSAHAEIVAIRNAAATINNYRLIDTTLYVTLEPCMMCTGAMLHARIKRLVFAAKDPKTGATEFLKKNCWNHNIICEHGLLADNASEILRQFFKARR